MRPFVAALLILAFPANAQPARQSERPAIPAEMLVPNEDARAAFEAMSSRPMTVQILDGVIAAHPERYRQIDEVLARILARGEQDPNWQNSGVDLRAVVAARAGGLAGNMASGASQFGATLTYFDDGSIDAFISPGWILVAQHGVPLESHGTGQVEINHISPKTIVVERITYQLRGNAYRCMSVILIMRGVETLQGRTLCAVTQEVGPGLYRNQLFDSEGYRLAASERAEPFRIVPRTPIPAQRETR